MIRGVIFDMDGVMIDSERQSNEGWLWAAEQLGVEMPMWLIDSFKGAPNTLSCQFLTIITMAKLTIGKHENSERSIFIKFGKKKGCR